jgi:hypothetical protein
MLSRRDAIEVVLALIATEPSGQTPGKPLTRRLLINPHREEVIQIDFGSGAATVKAIEVVQGAVKATVTTSELLAALGAKTGD